ncbi:glycosyltransferase [Microlunatus ginsengisoli]|uniref:glycosyltransferase n=1 Tax=Microlunatus ginsengisoli TaxID=363863 RepID=UPI0031D24D6F
MPALLLVLPVVIPILLFETSHRLAYVAFSAYLAFWLAASLSLAVRQAIEYRTMKRYRELNWEARLRHLNDPYARMHELADQPRLDPSEAEELQALNVWTHSGPEVPAPDEVHHLIVIPVYSEGRAILEQSLEAILAANYAADRLMICLTFEARSPIWNEERIEQLRATYGGRFGRFLTTRHPDGLPGEGRVKGANISWGAQEARRELLRDGIRDHQVIVSAFDADTRPSPHYFQVLSYTYLTNPNRDVDSYQPVLLFHNNAWEVTSASRLVGYIASMWTLVDSTRPKRLRIFSSHAMGMRALVGVDFWSTNVIPDDSRQYWRMYFGTNGRAKTVPLHLPVYLDAVQSHSWWATMREQYRQIRRWSYGVIDFPYIMEQNLTNQRIPLRDKAMQTFRQLSQFHLWATVPLLLLSLRLMVNYLGPTVTRSSESIAELAAHANYDWSTSPLVEIASRVNSLAPVLTVVSLVISAVVALKLLPKRPRHRGPQTWVKMVLEFCALPIVAPVFFCLPAIDAQVRLLFRRYLGFRVTVKLRSDIAHRIR